MSDPGSFPTLKYLAQSAAGFFQALRARSSKFPKISYLEALSSQYGLTVEQVLANTGKFQTGKDRKSRLESRPLEKEPTGVIKGQSDEFKKNKTKRSPVAKRPPICRAGCEDGKGSMAKAAHLKSSSYPVVNPNFWPAANPEKMIICDAIYRAPPSFPSLRL